MKTFKIIGVRPLKGCNKHVIKNLKSDTFYTFYNNYEFKDEKVIKSEQQVPDNLYASNISLHAIVGMNGSGKSTIVELIIRIINNLSFYILGEQSGTYAAESLVPVRRLNAELYYGHGPAAHAREWRSARKRRHWRAYSSPSGRP